MEGCETAAEAVFDFGVAPGGEIPLGDDAEQRAAPRHDAEGVELVELFPLRLIHVETVAGPAVRRESAGFGQRAGVGGEQPFGLLAALRFEQPRQQGKFQQPERCRAGFDELERVDPDGKPVAGNGEVERGREAELPVPGFEHEPRGGRSQFPEGEIPDLITPLFRPRVNLSPQQLLRPAPEHAPGRAETERLRIKFQTLPLIPHVLLLSRAGRRQRRQMA